MVSRLKNEQIVDCEERVQDLQSWEKKINTESLHPENTSTIRGLCKKA